MLGSQHNISEITSFEDFANTVVSHEEAKYQSVFSQISTYSYDEDRNIIISD